MHLLMHEMITRSPTAVLVQPEPTWVTTPTPSWPRIRPSVTAGTSPLRMCRSVPQIVVVSIRTIASVGCCRTGSGTSCHALAPGPWNTSAFMVGPRLPPRARSCGWWSRLGRDGPDGGGCGALDGAAVPGQHLGELPTDEEHDRRNRC